MRIFFLMLIVAGTLSAFSGRLATADVTITLPEGFKAITVVEELGRNRHIAVHSNGDIYVKLEKLKEGKGIFVLRNNNGKYEVVKSFGDYIGTGILIRNGYLYATSDNSVYRYKLNGNNEVADPDHPEKIVTDLLVGSQHTSKSTSKLRRRPLLVLSQ